MNNADFFFQIRNPDEIRTFFQDTSNQLERNLDDYYDSKARVLYILADSLMDSLLQLHKHTQEHYQEIAEQAFNPSSVDYFQIYKSMLDSNYEMPERLPDVIIHLWAIFLFYKDIRPDANQGTLQRLDIVTLNLAAYASVYRNFHMADAIKKDFLYKITPAAGGKEKAKAYWLEKGTSPEKLQALVDDKRRKKPGLSKNRIIEIISAKTKISKSTIRDNIK